MSKYRLRIILLSLLASLLFVYSDSPKIRAVLSQSWLSPALLSVQKGPDVPSLPTSLNGNTDCIQDGPYDCVVTTTTGTFSTSNNLKLTNSSAYRSLISYVDNRPRSIAIPNSDTIINYTTEPSYGFYLYFTYNLHSSITTTTVPGTAEKQYQINRLYDGKLADKANHRLAADYISMSFSGNGQWMIVSQPNVAMLRVNLQTFEVVPFAAGFNYTIGLDPAIKTAITNDGRYVVVASKTFGRFEVYDLDTCDAVPNTISGPVSCQSRNLQSLMQQQVPGYISIGQARFINNSTLKLYADYNDSGHKIASFIIKPQGSSTHQIDYLALGESYSSGEGAFSYQQGTDTNDNRCHVSMISYPYLAARDLNYNSFHSVGCSGAKIDDITNTSDGYQSQASPRQSRQARVNQIPSIIANFQPGYIDQLDFVSAYQPKTITISIGGNDIGFSSIVRSCTESLGTCYSTYEDRLELVREINSKFPALVSTYQTIKNQSPPDTNIYIVGYPQIVKPDGDCALNVHLNSDELIFAQQLVDYLNLVIQRAAAKTGVYYADIKDALSGHRLCEAQPGSVAVNGLTAGHDIPGFLHGPMGIESYHPNDFGHQLIENKLLSVTQNLSAPMPAPNLAATVPSETGLEILNAPQSGRSITSTHFDENLSNDIIPRGIPSDISVNGLDYSLKPSAVYGVELHSNPVDLGNFSSDSGANLSFQVSIPNNVLVGFHSIHIYGLNLSGETIDLYKTIYVAASADDYNGNGTPNTNDLCLFIPPSGADHDLDGIDDGCDGSINQPPPPDPTALTNQNTPNEPTNQTLPAPDSSTQTSSSNTQLANEFGQTNSALTQTIYPEQKYYSLVSLGPGDSFHEGNSSSSKAEGKVLSYSTTQSFKAKKSKTPVISAIVSISILAFSIWKFPLLRKLI